MMKEHSGKIDRHYFDEFIRDKCGLQRPEVKTGPGFGADVSIVSLPEGQAMALTSDPLSLIPSLGLYESAWLSVHLMANDMVTTGVAPMYGQFVLNLPAGLSGKDFAIYWEHIHQLCKKTGIAVTGGHTGFIEGQNSTIAGGGTLIATGPVEKFLVSSAARQGDTLLVTKSCALSAAAILAMSFPKTVKNQAGKETWELACEAFYQTSSLKEGLVAPMVKEGAVSAMHDVTEGGVLGALFELAVASGSGLLIREDLLPVDPVQAEVCKIFDLDPTRCIGAGSMIIACKPEWAGRIIQRLNEEQIPCTEVGELTPDSEEYKLHNEKKEKKQLEYIEKDPYWAAFFKAIQSGWK